MFKKITALHSANSFSFAIVVGDLFGDLFTDIEPLLEGRIKIPLTTYFSQGNSVLPEAVAQKLEENGGELCENLHYLGKRVTIKTSEGPRIVALGGNLKPDLATGPSEDKCTPFYSLGDAKALKGANTADILITNEWPANIRTGSKVEFKHGDEPDPVTQQCIADLCATVKPRYHFSSSGTTFFEREPFFHAPSNDDQTTGYAITRFISLASFGNPTKQKWIYAFTLDPTSSKSAAIPPGSTASPFTLAPIKRAFPSQGESFRFSTDSQSHHRPSKRRRNQPPPGPGECFFCLSNPSLATHLVTSIGTDAYLTTARGPLTTSNTFPALGFPAHILIIPLAHTPTLMSIADVDARASTLREMERYRGALNSMVAERSQGRLGSVTWEVSRTGGIHTHWQFLPVPVDLIQRGLVEAAFKVEAENEKYPAFKATTPDVDDDSDVHDHFRVWIWRQSTATGTDSLGSNGIEGKAVVHTSLSLPLDASFRFDLQFGRTVLGKLLGVEKRRDWRDCGQSEPEETADGNVCKAAFKKYDFSLEE